MESKLLRIPLFSPFLRCDPQGELPEMELDCWETPRLLSGPGLDLPFSPNASGENPQWLQSSMIQARTRTTMTRWTNKLCSLYQIARRPPAGTESRLSVIHFAFSFLFFFFLFLRSSLFADPLISMTSCRISGVQVSNPRLSKVLNPSKETDHGV